MIEPLFFTSATAIGGVLGYLLHVTLSWKEWAKLAGHQGLGFREFITGDVPGHLSGFIAVLITYFSLPLLGSLPWVESALGFSPQVNFLSASACAFISQSVAMKLRNIGRKIQDPPQL